MATDTTITALNDLIETCKDGEEGFRTAADGLRDPQTKSLFEQYSRQRAEMARQLQDEVARLGGAPERSGSLSASLHRGWMNIKTAIAGRDDQLIVAEAERGEEIAKKAYEAVLQERLEPRTRALVEQQAAQVRAVHDRVRGLEKTSTR